MRKQVTSTSNGQYLVRFFNDLRSSRRVLREGFERCQAKNPQTSDIVLRDIGGSETI